MPSKHTDFPRPGLCRGWAGVRLAAAFGPDAAAGAYPGPPGRSAVLDAYVQVRPVSGAADGLITGTVVRQAYL